MNSHNNNTDKTKKDTPDVNVLGDPRVVENPGGDEIQERTRRDGELTSELEAGIHQPLLPLPEQEHLSTNAPWLRAALLGANDGLVSVASLMAGVGAVRKDVKSMAIAALAGLVAGACSMAIGEYVSVFGQRDAELADVEKERVEHTKGPDHVARKLEELTRIYQERGLSYSLAKQVATELSKGDVVRVHARDELGIDVDDLSNPLQAALASAMAFLVGGLIPFLSAGFITNFLIRILVLVGTSSLALIGFGALGASLGGAPIIKAAFRVLLGGWSALLITFGVLKAFGSPGL